MVKIKVDDCFPDVTFFQLVDGNPKTIRTSDIFNEKKIILVSVPGAFTPTCSNDHLPGYIKLFDEFKKKGIDDIYFVASNDPFVMDAWGKANNVGDKIIMLADPFLNFTKAIGADVDKSARGLGIRSNRFTMLVDNMKALNIQESTLIDIFS